MNTKDKFSTPSRICISLIAFFFLLAGCSGGSSSSGGTVTGVATPSKVSVVNTN